MATSRGRFVVEIVDAEHALEGAGFAVRRPFPTRRLDHVDPFLLLDEMGPANLGPGEAKGAPDHPHRGFETVTYLLDGRMEHRDSQGNAGRLEPGDVQWMTAGAGVVHSELPEPTFAAAGGRMHGFQLWVNLPRRDKMMAPRYQEVSSSKIPVANSPDGRIRVRVIAGEALGVKAVIDTRTPIAYLHYTLAPGAVVVQPVPRAYSAFVYVFGGEGRIGREGQAAADGQMAILSTDADEVQLASTGPATAPLQALLVAGIPLGEPVVRYGPFVMNTREEIVQAVQDYQTGRMGRIQSA